MMGLWLSELTRVYDICRRVGLETTIVSIAGGRVPLDPRSRMAMTGGVRVYFDDPEFMSVLETTAPVSSLAPERYDGIYLAGGHGAVFDFPEHPALSRVVSSIWARGGVVAAMCHGSSGLLGAQDVDGSPLVAGRRVTGFSDSEEGILRTRHEVPMLVEASLRAQGARYSKHPVPLLPHVVVDGRLVTGQNPASARGVGQALVAALRRR